MSSSLLNCLMLNKLKNLVINPEDCFGMVFVLMVASITWNGATAFGNLDDDVTNKITYVLEIPPSSSI